MHAPSGFLSVDRHIRECFSKTRTTRTTKKAQPKENLGRGANESTFRNSLNSVVRFTETPSAVEALWCKPDVQQKGWIMTLGAVTINCSPHGDKLVQSIRFLTVVHSFTHVRSSVQDKEYRCLILQSTHRVELASNMTEEDW